MEIVKITCSTCNCVCLGYLSACLINVSAIEHVFSLIYADLISKLALLLFVMAGKRSSDISNVSFVSQIQ